MYEIILNPKTLVLLLMVMALMSYLVLFKKGKIKRKITHWIFLMKNRYIKSGDDYEESLQVYTMMVQANEIFVEEEDRKKIFMIKNQWGFNAMIPAEGASPVFARRKGKYLVKIVMSGIGESLPIKKAKLQYIDKKKKVAVTLAEEDFTQESEVFRGASGKTIEITEVNEAKQAPGFHGWSTTIKPEDLV